MDRKKLIRTIWTRSAELNMDRDSVHFLLKDVTGQERMRDCTEEQLQKMVTALKLQKGLQEQYSQRATSRQFKYISSLEYQLGWKGNPERMRGFLKKNKYPLNIAWLTQEEASNVIEGLKKILERGKQKEANGC